MATIGVQQVETLKRLSQASDLTRLVQSAKAGEPEALERLVDLYARRLYGLLYRLTGSRTDAEDLLQETFIRMLRGLQAYRENGRFEAWLFSIAANLARDFLRRQNRTAPAGNSLSRNEQQPVLPSNEPTPEEKFAEAERVDLLQRAMNELSSSEREIVSLRFFSGLGFKDIAEILGVPLGTALARAHRAVKHLREKLQSHDI